MSLELYPNLKQLCRLCLGDNLPTVDIFVNSQNKGLHNPSIAMRIMACTALETQIDDDLPTQICIKCRFKLENFYNFRKRSQLADSKLRKHLRLLNMGKPSRVFSSNDDDDDELPLSHELELNEEDDLLDKLCVEVEEYKKILKDKCKAELRDELVDQIRHEIRTEIKNECREVEIKKLLNDLEQFLHSRRHNHESITDKMQDLPTTTEFAYQNLPTDMVTHTCEAGEEDSIKIELPDVEYDYNSGDKAMTNDCVDSILGIGNMTEDNTDPECSKILNTTKRERGKGQDCKFPLLLNGKYYKILKLISETQHQKSAKGVIAVCQLCSKKLKASLKITSNLVAHLKTKHPDSFAAYTFEKVNQRKRKRTHKCSME